MSCLDSRICVVTVPRFVRTLLARFCRGASESISSVAIDDSSGVSSECSFSSDDFVVGCAACLSGTCGVLGPDPVAAWVGSPRASYRIPFFLLGGILKTAGDTCCEV